jgi:hypothetical protein
MCHQVSSKFNLVSHRPTLFEFKTKHFINFFKNAKINGHKTCNWNGKTEKQQCKHPAFLAVYDR